MGLRIDLESRDTRFEVHKKKEVRQERTVQSKVFLMSMTYPARA